MSLSPERLMRWTLALACVLALSGCGADSPASLINSGKEYVAKKDHKAAAIQFKSALQADPKSAEARFLLGQALLSSGDPSGAVLELSKVLDQKYDPNLAVPALARAMLLTGQYKKLSTLYGDLTLSDPLAHASLKSSVATAWGAQGNKAKTEAAIAAALQAAPDFGPAQILNARILAGQHDFDASVALVEKVLAREPSLYEAWHLKGEILALAKNDITGAETVPIALTPCARSCPSIRKPSSSMRMWPSPKETCPRRATWCKCCSRRHPTTPASCNWPARWRARQARWCWQRPTSPRHCR